MKVRIVKVTEYTENTLLFDIEPGMNPAYQLNRIPSQSEISSIMMFVSKFKAYPPSPQTVSESFDFVKVGLWASDYTGCWTIDKVILEQTDIIEEHKEDFGEFNINEILEL